MTVPTSSGRQRLLQQIASRVPHSASEDCVRAGIDGVDGAGKTVLAVGWPNSCTRVVGRWSASRSTTDTTLASCAKGSGWTHQKDSG